MQLNQKDFIFTSQLMVLKYRKIIKELGKHGVSRMSVSLDSWDADFHDEMRGRKDSWKKAIQALEYIQEAGMDPYLNVTVGHYNAKSEDLKMLLDYSKKKRYRTLVNVACLIMWNQVTTLFAMKKT